MSFYLGLLGFTGFYWFFFQGVPHLLTPAPSLWLRPPLSRKPRGFHFFFIVCKRVKKKPKKKFKEKVGRPPFSFFSLILRVAISHTHTHTHTQRANWSTLWPVKWTLYAAVCVSVCVCVCVCVCVWVCVSVRRLERNFGEKKEKNVSVWFIWPAGSFLSFHAQQPLLSFVYTLSPSLRCGNGKLNKKKGERKKKLLKEKIKAKKKETGHLSRRPFFFPFFFIDTFIFFEWMNRSLYS